MFSIKKERYYHLPHNSTRIDEIEFILSILDINKGIYTAKELQKIILVEQFKQNKFATFHPKPFENFTNYDDRKKLRKHFEELDKETSCPDHVIKSVYSKIQSLGPSEALHYFLKERKNAYNEFLAEPENKFESFINTPYSKNKIWKYVWAEFVRDYIQFLSYIGLIPAYYDLSPKIRAGIKESFSDKLVFLLFNKLNRRNLI